MRRQTDLLESLWEDLHVRGRRGQASWFRLTSVAIYSSSTFQQIQYQPNHQLLLLRTALRYE